MSYTVTQLKDEPIIIVTYTDPFIPDEDVPGAHHETSELLEHMPGTIYRIIDARIPKGSLDNLVETLYLSSRGKAGGTADPRIRSILVGTSEIVQRFAEAMKQRQYGAFNMPLFATLDEGLAYARAALQETLAG